MVSLFINPFQSGVRVSVSAVSLFQCGVVPGLYVTPSFSSLCPLLPSDTVHIQAKLIQEVREIHVAVVIFEGVFSVDTFYACILCTCT